MKKGVNLREKAPVNQHIDIKNQLRNRIGEFIFTVILWTIVLFQPVG